MANYPASQPGSQRHTLSVLVENRPGVLARIAGLFARRAFNINSLSVSPTERPDISRVTVTADVEAVPLECRRQDRRPAGAFGALRCD